MNALVKCPGCGFGGRLPDALARLKSIVCPQCKSAVPVEQLRRGAPSEDATYPIWVDGMPSVRDRTPAPFPAPALPSTAAVPAPAPAPVPAPAPAMAAAAVSAAPAPAAVASPVAAPRMAAPAQAPVTAPIPAPDAYTGDFMKEEAGRFAQYVATRLGELQKKRLQLADAENRFETMTMEQKQELYRARAGVVAEAERVKEREIQLQKKETTLVAREAELATREAEVAARESRVARAEGRAAETDRRTAELRSAIDQLEARRTALAEERETLNRRAEALDRAEMAQHRRAAELDELDERLRLEQEEFERDREQEIRGRAG